VGPDRGGEVRLLTRIAQVVPAIPSFAVDDGFAYRIPDHLATVTVGSIVRVPVGGRRLRGWVVGVREGRTERTLRDIISVSGARPIFDDRQLGVLRWAALHYVAPTSVVLPKAGPPNLPGKGRVVQLETVDDSAVSHPRMVEEILAGKRPSPRVVLGPGPWHDTIGADAAPLLAAGRNVLVVVPTNVEVDALGAALAGRLGHRRVLVVGDTDAKGTTAAWVAAFATPGRLVVGTREVAFWGLPRLSLVIVVEPGRRVMKSPQTPTVDTGRLLRRRSAVERMGLVMLGQVPTVESLAAGMDVEEGPGRVWPVVEVIDRAEEPPGAGVVMNAVKRAVGVALRRGQSVFVLVNRRGYAPAVRCVNCRALRTCSTCGAAPGRGAACHRCGSPNGPCTECGGGRFEPLGAGVGRVVEELARSFGDAVAASPGASPVLVGTERDLVGMADVSVGVALDVDGMLLAPNYRAEEEALRVLSRLATFVAGGSGSRLVLQTAQPRHRVVEALRRGRGADVVADMVADRGAAGFPPSRELMAVETGGDPTSVIEGLDGLGPGVDVLGPAETRHGWRWLVQADDLKATRVQLRSLVQSWRDEGLRVRIDVDPIDL
jgi:primosomal protein N' (replication factor Y)